MRPLIGAIEGPRLRILVLLQRYSHATVEELARHLGVTSATVRRHLDILQRDGLVSFQVVRRHTGRPEHAYSLTEAGQEALPKDYAGLSRILLQELATLGAEPLPSLNGNDLLQTLFLRAAQQIVQKHRELFVGRSLPERVAALHTILEAENFCPELEYGADSVRFHLLNCPFRQVAMQHEAVCFLDRHLIATVLGVPVSQEACINRGGHGCCYSAPFKVLASTQRDLPQRL